MWRGQLQIQCNQSWLSLLNLWPWCAHDQWLIVRIECLSPWSIDNNTGWYIRNTDIVLPSFLVLFHLLISNMPIELSNCIVEKSRLICKTRFSSCNRKRWSHWQVIILYKLWYHVLFFQQSFFILIFYLGVFGIICINNLLRVRKWSYAHNFSKGEVLRWYTWGLLTAC